MSLQLFNALIKSAVPYYFICACNHTWSVFHLLATVGNFRRYTYIQRRGHHNVTQFPAFCVLYTLLNHVHRGHKAKFSVSL